ncbi:MAG: HlyD family efflux transporter periplasmic adaptor subunit [Pseudomonadota bacterium]|nr:HlyD family efflux transporter periplasmic adaptor subunit [Pseudomonadota bacterium]
MPDDHKIFPSVAEATAEPLTHGSANAKRKPRNKQKLMLIGLGAIIAKIALVAGAHWLLVGSHYVTTDNAYVGAATAQIDAQVSGQILEVRVEDTQSVRRGDILAVIDPADATLAEKRAEADYHRAVQRVSQYYAQEASAEAEVSARQTDLDRASLDYARRQKLAATGAVSAEELTATKAAEEAARAHLAAAQQNLEAQRALTRDATVEDHPETVSALAAWDSAKLALARTVIRAPIDGVVVQKSVQVGERIDPGKPLMIVAPLAEAYVDANFKEGQLGRVAIGQPVHLTSDLYGEKVVYHGRVAGLGGGTGSAFAIIPAQNATGNWIKVVQRVPVRVSLDAEELAEHPLRVGLSMEAKIDVRKTAI